MDFTDRDYDRAMAIVRALLDPSEDLLAFKYREEIDKFESGLSIFDLQNHANSFQRELALLEDVNKHRDIDIEFPAFSIDDGFTIPVSLSFLGFPWFPVHTPYRVWRHHPFWYELIFGFFDDLESSWTEYLSHFYGLTSLSVEGARASFLKNATNFLAHRIAAIRQFNSDDGNPPGVDNTSNIPPTMGSPAAPTVGCTFTVTTNTSWLRVFWSGAYYLTSNYFGAPTTPTNGVLQSGTYMFGVDGGPYGTSIQWDKNAVCTLPGTPNVHLNY